MRHVIIFYLCNENSQIIKKNLCWSSYITISFPHGILWQTPPYSPYTPEIPARKILSISYITGDIKANLGKKNGEEKNISQSLNRCHGLLNRGHELLSYDHDLLSCGHELLNRGHK